MSGIREFDFLTQETVRLTECLDEENFQREFFLENPLFEEIETIEQINYPNNPGVVFNILWAGNTVSLRGVPTDDISAVFDRLEAGDLSLLRRFKVSESQIETLFFFECEYKELAEILVDQLFSKRYPMEEEMVCNISDPGFSWWFINNPNGFRINFKSHKLEQAQKRMKLGPIGDIVVASIRFKKIIEHIKEFLPIQNVSINEKSFVLESYEASNPIIDDLKNLFENGEVDIDSALMCELASTEKLFLIELATIRRFWIYLEEVTSSTVAMN